MEQATYSSNRKNLLTLRPHLRPHLRSRMKIPCAKPLSYVSNGLRIRGKEPVFYVRPDLVFPHLDSQTRIAVPFLKHRLIHGFERILRLLRALELGI